MIQELYLYLVKGHWILNLRSLRSFRVATVKSFYLQAQSYKIRNFSWLLQAGIGFEAHCNWVPKQAHSFPLKGSTHMESDYQKVYLCKLIT